MQAARLQAAIFLRVGLVLFVAVGFPRKTSADPIRDQQYIPAPPFNIQSVVDATALDKAQTFTVGIAGRLTEIDVLIETFGSEGSKLFLDLLPTINGVPVNDDELRLARLSLSTDAPATPLAFVGFDVRPFGIMVAPDDILAIALHVTGSSATVWYGQEVNGYSRGEHFVRSPNGTNGLPTTWSSFPGGFIDTGFKTFVDPSPSPTPEPCTLLLIATAPAWLWLRGMRKHARAS
jgi:hypothetical protein